MVHISVSMAPAVYRGGSLPEKAPNLVHNYHAKHTYYMHKYFWPRDSLRPATSSYGPQQTEEQFERRFRIPHALLERILFAVVQQNRYFGQGLRPKAAGRMGVSSLLKVIFALREIAYDIPTDLADDLFDVSEISAADCLQHFCSAVDACLGPNYLREPTAEDLTRISLSVFAFPGVLVAWTVAVGSGRNAQKSCRVS